MTGTNNPSNGKTTKNSIGTGCDQFYNDINATYQLLKSYTGLEIDMKSVDDFFKCFKTTFALWKNYLLTIRRVPFHIGLAQEILYMGLLDSNYASGSNKKTSPFGPWLSPLQDLGKKGISISRAVDQQRMRTPQNNLVYGHLVNAQKLANEIYKHFLGFLKQNKISGLKPSYQYPPIIQLCKGGGATLFKDFKVPTTIIMDEKKISKLADFSALPHELGHAICGAFKCSGLVEAITQKVDSLSIKHKDYWTSWIEECLADAIAVSIIRKGEILSLRHVLSECETNIIHVDRIRKKLAVHPIPHIRVLLVIEVGRILGIDRAFLKKTETEWNIFGKWKNKRWHNSLVYDRMLKKERQMTDFIKGVKPIAKALIDTSYNELGGKTVRDIFSNFNFKLAIAMENSIGNNKRELPIKKKKSALKKIRLHSGFTAFKKIFRWKGIVRT